MNEYMMIEKEYEESVEDTIIKKDLFDKINKVFSTMSERDKAIIKARLAGFDDEDYMTLEEIEKKFGVSRERIKQIQMKFFNCLRFIAKQD